MFLYSYSINTQLYVIDIKIIDIKIIIVKENVRNTGIWLDKDDNSAIRSPMHFDKIFQAAGLEQIHKSDQPGWPKDLFAIKMWVLKIKQ